MSKYFKIDRNSRKIIIDKHKSYNVNIDILDLIIDLQLERDQLKSNFKIQLEYDECLENKLKEIKDTCKYYKKYKDEWFEEECKNALDDIRDIVLGGEDNEI